MPFLNQLSTKKTCKITRRYLANAEILADKKAINAIRNCFEEMQPFNEQTPKQFLISFSAGFISREGDRVNPEEIIDIRNMIQKKLDRKKVPSTIVLRERSN